jgi:hypothetical protein
VSPDGDGFQRSVVFGRRFRLTRDRRTYGRWAYDLAVA